MDYVIGDKIVVIQLNSGEIIVAYMEDADPFDDTNLTHVEISYPALLMPHQTQQGQVVFQKYFPFSEQEKGKLRRAAIRSVTEPLQAFGKAYDDWVTQVKASDAGIIVPS